MRRFEVIEDHLKLLRRAYITWNDCEFGAPSIDCKRPYGNSSVYNDIAEILNIPSIDEQGEFSDDDEQRMEKLHNETQTVLQVILATGQMKAGMYVKDSDYGIDWRSE